MQKMISISNKALSPFNPVQFGYEDCESGHFFGPAVRTFTLIHFVVSGKGTFKIGNREYSVSGGEMFVIPPFVKTYYESDRENPWSYIWIGFEADFFPVELSDKITCAEALRVFEAMKRCEDFDTGRELFLTAKIWELFSVIENRREEKTDYAQRAVSIIHSEYMMELGVEEIAKRLGLERSYFSSVFKKAVGKSPSKYLMEYRMTAAGKLFENTQMSVATVAHSVGYVDVFNFSKAFKKYFGISPVEYKKKTKSE